MLPPLITPYLPQYAEGAVEDSARKLLHGSVSAIFGGLFPFLHSDEEWPKCKECGNYLVPYLQINATSVNTPEEFRRRVPPLEPEGTTILQVLLCTTESDNGTCFEGWANCITEEESWLVRRIHFAADGHDLADPAAYESVRAELEESEEITVIPERVITGWTAGRPETEHDEGYLYKPEDEQYYEEHEPAEGLKLLGYPIRGKYYNNTSLSDNCQAGDAGSHDEWQCLIQLGTREEDNPIYTTGNIYVNQCALHPDSFEAVCSGTW
ncbi:hypothetical protein GY45DRAFT_1327040 [Cubamyces sp. BRFM 1775]|nr:hypothetical protein GY45DRAFT_1327040 [Cubamyces sp. BRFM 1775]